MPIVVRLPALAIPPERSERHSFCSRVRQAGLGTFFVSIAVNAALGIYAILTPDFGETQEKILGTSLCVTGAVLVALACEPAWERRVLGPVPIAGAVLGAAGFTLTVVAIWAGPEGDVYGNVTVTVFTAAVACVLASLLGLARLAPRHRWVFVVTLALLVVATTLEGAAPWLDEPGDAYIRAMGVALVALAAFVVTVPVLHWVDRGAVAAAAATDAVRSCPYCGKAVEGGVGEDLRCGRCGREFAVSGRSST